MQRFEELVIYNTPVPGFTSPTLPDNHPHRQGAQIAANYLPEAAAQQIVAARPKKLHADERAECSRNATGTQIYINCLTSMPSQHKQGVSHGQDE